VKTALQRAALGVAVVTATWGTAYAEGTRFDPSPGAGPAHQPQHGSPMPPVLHLAQAKPRRPAQQADPDPTPPDFGTPQGTARIAATAGFLDVVGIKLGMREAEAVELLKKHNPALTLTPLQLLTYTATPDVSRTPVIVADMKPTQDHQFERFSLELTYSPSAAYVWGISREYSFARNELPTFENTVESFQKKYGPETFRLTNEQLVWVFDAAGKVVPGQEGRAIFSRCSSNQWRSNVAGISAGGNRPTRDNRLSNSWYDQQLRGGYYTSQHGRDHANGVCHNHASIHVGLQRASLGPGHPPNLLRGFVMRAANHQLEASGIQASHEQLAAAADAIQKRRAGEAEKRGGPKL